MFMILISTSEKESAHINLMDLSSHQLDNKSIKILNSNEFLNQMTAQDLKDIINHTQNMDIHKKESFLLFLRDIKKSYNDQALKEFHSRYKGISESELYYAEEIADERGLFHNVSKIVSRYFDYQHYSRELFRNEFISSIHTQGIAVFTR